jgi:transcriptional regulator with XRE-family HTH domain
VRALRQRLGWRQTDLAARGGLSQGVVSRLERGELARLSVASIERLAVALGAELDVRLWWRGEELDRLLDAPHAAVVDRVVDVLTSLGWRCAVEVTFAISGERGSVDVLAWNPGSSWVLVVEAKSVIPDLQSMLGSLDRKTRLAARLASERGWPADGVARVVVLPDTATNRRRAGRYGSILGAAFPMGGRDFRRWLAEPIRGCRDLAQGRAPAVSAMWFLSDMTVLTTTRRRRVRKCPGHPGTARIGGGPRSPGVVPARSNGHDSVAESPWPRL